MEATSLLDFVIHKLHTTHQTHRFVADKTGIPYSTITKISQGVIQKPRVQHVEALARHFGVSFDCLEELK